MDETEVKLQFLYKTLDRIDHYINLANIKASFLIAAILAVIAFSFGNHNSIINILGTGCLNYVDDILFVTINLTGIVALFFAIKVIWARLDSGEKPGKYNSLLFWGSINKMALGTYQENIGKTTSDQITNDLTSQIKTLSKIVIDKYSLINKCVILVIIMLFQIFALLILKLFTWEG